jgi:hypothetical protein
MAGKPTLGPTDIAGDVSALPAGQTLLELCRIEIGTATGGASSRLEHRLLFLSVAVGLSELTGDRLESIEFLADLSVSLSRLRLSESGLGQGFRVLLVETKSAL